MNNTFVAVLAALGDAQGVSRGRMFGSDGLKFGGKVFAMEVRGRLVVKLAADRVRDLVAVGCEHFDPGHGRQMREWASIPQDDRFDWTAIAREALHRAEGR